MLALIQGFLVFSAISAISAVLGSLVAGIVYRGKDGERYSPFNHFISELGEVGVSRLAWAFNIGLMISGLGLLLASISLGVILPGVVAKFGMVAAVISSIGLFFVGVFPMHKMEPHATAAMTFFRGGLAMMILFTLAIGLPPHDKQVLPRAYSLVGLPAILSFAGFLALTARSMKSSRENPLSTEGVIRPRFWLLAIFEWSIFITIILWFLVIAVGLRSS